MSRFYDFKGISKEEALKILRRNKARVESINRAIKKLEEEKKEENLAALACSIYIETLEDKEEAK